MVQCSKFEALSAQALRKKATWRMVDESIVHCQRLTSVRHLMHDCTATLAVARETTGKLAQQCVDSGNLFLSTITCHPFVRFSNSEPPCSIKLHNNEIPCYENPF